MKSPRLVEVRGVGRSYGRRPRAWRRRDGRTHAVRGVDLAVGVGEVVALVGESGSGKSTLLRLVVSLERPDSGAVLYHPAGGAAVDLARLSGRARRRVARELQLVPQDPATSLPPWRSVGAILAEPLRVHGVVPRARVAEEVAALLARVGLEEELLVRRPFELSGGQRQRVAIARALTVRPRLLACDEVTSMLDASVQGQVLNLLTDLRRDDGLALLVVTHDLLVARHVADRTVVLSAGRVVEAGATEELIADPRHPTTRALVDGAGL